MAHDIPAVRKVYDYMGRVTYVWEIGVQEETLTEFMAALPPMPYNPTEREALNTLIAVALGAVKDYLGKYEVDIENKR